MLDDDDEKLLPYQMYLSIKYEKHASKMIQQVKTSL